MHRYVSQFSNADRHKTFLPSHFRHTLKRQTKQRARCRGKKKKKKKVSNFLQKPSSQPQARSCMPEFWHRQRRNFPDRCNGQHGNSFVVVPSQCMGVHVNGSSRHIDAALLSAVHQTRLTGAKRETSNQGSACQYPCGGKSTQKDSSIHACTLLSGLTCMDTSPKATAVTRTSKHRRKRRWRGYTLAPNR